MNPQKSKPLEFDGFKEIDLFGMSIRVGLATIPGYGGALAQAYSEWDGDRRNKRIAKFFEDFDARLKKLEKLIDPKQLRDEDFQLLEEIIRRVSIEHTENKRMRFSNLLLNSWTSGIGDTFDKKMIFVRATEKFTDNHIKILLFLKIEKQNAQYPKVADIASMLGMKTEDKKLILYPILVHLAGEFAFINRSWTLGQEKKSSVILSCNNLSPENIAGKCRHAITSLGIEFLEYISDEHSTEVKI